MELITKSFAAQCLAFPDRVDILLAEVNTVTGAKDLLDKASAMQHYAERLKAGIEVERPIAIGVLKIKAKLGELMPAGKVGAGRGNKISHEIGDFNKNTISAYRKLHDNKDRLEEYCESTDDVPTQGEFIRYCTGAHVSQNSGENEWYTPKEYIEAARTVMGNIDLDPATSKAANKIVAATKFYTAGDDGLNHEWSGNVWMNPPYAKDLIGKFAEKLVESELTSACVLVNNATETAWFQLIATESSAMCFPKGRVKFWHPDRVSAPLQGQAVLYIGRRISAFCKAFKTFGVCVVVS